MKKYLLITVLIVSAIMISAQTESQFIEPVPSDNPSAVQRAQIDRRYGFFCHFGINTYADKEWTDGTVLPQVYAPPANIAEKADEWVRFAKEAGMTYFLCITKHHDGFCLWDSKHTDYDVGNAGVTVKTDVVKAISEACKKYGIAFAVYYSTWDRHEKSFSEHKLYKEYVKNQLTELLTQYGPVAEIWFDGSWAKRSENWYLPEIYDHIKRLQPDCQVTNNWTIGLPDNPNCGSDKAPPKLQQNGWPIQYWPSDFRIADPHLPRSDDPKQFSHQGKSYYMPFEATITVCAKNNWFGFGGDLGAKSVDQLEKMYRQCTANDNLLVFNVPPMKDGNLVPSQAEAIRKLAQRLK